VLDRQLANHEYISGSKYTIADMAIWPWYGGVVTNKVYGAAEFLEAHSYTNVLRWANEIGNRPAVIRGRMVNRVTGDPAEQVPERHSNRDFDGKAI
jgi:GST-like protein